MIIDSQRTILIVDDCEADRLVYRRFLERERRYSYQIVECESATEALEYVQQRMPDLIFLDFLLPDATGLELLAELSFCTGRNQLPAIMLTGQGDETIAVQAIKSGAQDYLVKGKLTCEALHRASHTVMERVRLMHQVEQQHEQQRLMGAIALRIRQSLSLEAVLNTAVSEIRNFIKSDRVIVYQFNPDMSGTIIAESVLSEWNSCLNLRLEDICFDLITNSSGSFYQYCQRVNPDIYAAGFSQCHIKLLEEFQVKANLIVPIFCGTQPDTEKPVWGLLVAHQCSAPRQWQQSEIDLLEQLSVQLAIAIQQAELYENLQTLNAQLEAKVTERTAELQQSERKFRAIFEQTFQFIGLLTTDGTILEINQAPLDFNAAKREDAIGQRFWELAAWKNSPQVQNALQNAIALAAVGNFVRYEITLPNAQGVVKTFDFSLKPIFNEIGEVVLLLPEARDITERKLAEEALHQLNQQLEARVSQRTSDLEQANVQLRSEIAERQRIEAQLQQRQQEFLALVENAPDVIARINQDFRYVYINPAVEVALGLPPQTFIGKTNRELEFSEQTITRIEEGVQLVFATGQEHLIEFSIENINGLRYYQARMMPELCAAGKVVSVLAIARDITLLKETEIELRETNALLQAIIQSAPIGIDFVDPDGNVVFWNPMAERIFGWRADEVIGKPLAIIPETEQQVFREFIRQTLTGSALIQVETCRQKQDGSLVDISLSTASVCDSQGKVIGCIGITQDISERKQAQLEIIRNRDLREAIFNQSTDAIFLVDGDTFKTIDCNRRAIELFEAGSKDELIDIHGHTLHRHEFSPEDIELAKTEMDTKGFWSREIEYVSLKGNCFWGNIAAKKIKVAGKMMSLVRISDVSDRKQTEKQIRRSLEEKETLLKEIHHRVKNNLQIISSLLRMQSRRPLDEATAVLFTESQNRVQSMALIHEHLYQSPELSQIEFGEYIRSLTDNLFRCYGVSQKAIVLKIETNGLKLNLDTAIPCGLIINELISNSLKYAFPNQRGGEMIIRLVSSTNNTFTLTVGDNGIGIPNTLDWQNTNSLGLRIVHNLTRQLKGNIILDRNGGSTFDITFSKALKS